MEETPTAPRKVEFVTTAQAAVRPEAYRFLSAFLEAARREEEAESADLNTVRRVPLESLLEEGKVVGPFRRERKGKFTDICACHEPMDSGDLEVGKDAQMFTLPGTDEPLQTIEVEVISVTPEGIRVREKNSEKNGVIPEGKDVYLTKSSSTFVRAVRRRLEELLAAQKFWELDMLPALNKEARMDDAYFARLRPGDSVKDEPFREAFRLVTQPNRLCGIKGPPGTGKTHLVGLAATNLVNQGKKCILVSKSHRAIENALFEIATAAKRCHENTPTIKVPWIAKKEGKERLSAESIMAGVVPLKEWAKTGPKGDREYCDPWAGLDIIGLTADAAVRENPLRDYPADFLFYEEAGQTPTFSVAAIHDLAKDIVLLGDEDQLSPIVRAAHSKELGVGDSALSFLQTRNPERVLSLPVSHRLSSPICQIVGEIYYPTLEPRLEPGRGRNSKIIKGAEEFQGVFFQQVDHRHLKKSCPEERAAILETIKTLLADFSYQETSEDDPRPIAPDDFCVLSPFRLQSTLIGHEIQNECGHKMLTGTIHKLQGQGRPVVLASLCASNLQFISSTAEWYFSPNLWNVTISRAKAICIIYGNLEALRNSRPKTLAGITYKAQMLEVIQRASENSIVP